jgi:AraC-like DNA-binding protein
MFRPRMISGGRLNRAAMNDTRPEIGIAGSTSRSRRNLVEVNPGAAAGALLQLGPEDRIRRILEMIESESPCRMSDLALQFNLSESRLQHLFKQKTGVGLGHLLTEQRLQKAALLLTHTALRIKEISAAVGYEHTSSFTRAFERRFAQAPKAYRRAAKSQCSDECRQPPP